MGYYHVICLCVRILLRELVVVEVKAWEIQCSMNGQTVQCKHLHHEPTGKKTLFEPNITCPSVSKNECESSGKIWLMSFLHFTTAISFDTSNEIGALYLHLRLAAL